METAIEQFTGIPGKLPVATVKCFSVIYSMTGAEHLEKLCQCDGPVFNCAATGQMCKHSYFAIRNICYLCNRENPCWLVKVVGTWLCYLLIAHFLFVERRSFCKVEKKPL